MWPNRQFPADLVKFNEKICYVKLHFLCSVRLQIYSYSVTLNLDWGLNVFEIPVTAWKVYVFAVILVRIFPYSVQMRKNVDQNNSEYGHFSRSVFFKSFSFRIFDFVIFLWSAAHKAQSFISIYNRQSK